MLKFLSLNVQIYVTPVFLASHHYTALWGFWKMNISILASRTKFQQTKNDTKTLKRKILLQNLSNPKPYFTFISECTRQIKKPFIQLSYLEWDITFISVALMENKKPKPQLVQIQPQKSIALTVQR